MIGFFINFDALSDFAYTKPTFISFFGIQVGNILSWKEQYVDIFKKLYDLYGDVIPLSKSFNTIMGRIDFCTNGSNEYYDLMDVPKKVSNGRYLKTNLSATDIVHKIKPLLDIRSVKGKKFDNQI